MKKTIGLLMLCALVAPNHPLADKRQGPHGGEAKRAQGTGPPLLIELVVRGDEKKQEIHVYGLSANYKEMNLTSSGYGGLTLRWRNLELPLEFHKVDKDGMHSNSDDRIEHYRTVGKFPRDADVQLEVTVAFPSKMGTGKATFRPFRPQTD